jgi:hypothetical protein
MCWTPIYANKQRKRTANTMAKRTANTMVNKILLIKLKDLAAKLYMFPPIYANKHK